MQTLEHIAKLPELAEQITREHALACGAARSALEHAKRAGEFLTQAKRQTKHGDWLPWLTANFSFSPRTAQNYIRIAERWGELEAKSETVSHLGLRDALALLAPAKELEPHEYCLIFPPMTDDEFEGLKADIQQHGLLKKITLFDGQILDGKERYRACLAVGVEPEFEDFNGDSDQALAFCVSENLYRQHFTPSQIAALEVELGAGNVC